MNQYTTTHPLNVFNFKVPTKTNKTQNNLEKKGDCRSLNVRRPRNHSLERHKLRTTSPDHFQLSFLIQIFARNNHGLRQNTTNTLCTAERRKQMPSKVKGECGLCSDLGSHLNGAWTCSCLEPQLNLLNILRQSQNQPPSCCFPAGVSFKLSPPQGRVSLCGSLLQDQPETVIPKPWNALQVGTPSSLRPRTHSELKRPQYGRTKQQSPGQGAGAAKGAAASLP